MVKIEFFNFLGHWVELFLNKSQSAGSPEVEFTAKDLPNGLYLYRIGAGEFLQVKNMISLKI